MPSGFGTSRPSTAGCTSIVASQRSCSAPVIAKYSNTIAESTSAAQRDPARSRRANRRSPPESCRHAIAIATGSAYVTALYLIQIAAASDMPATTKCQRRRVGLVDEHERDRHRERDERLALAAHVDPAQPLERRIAEQQEQAPRRRSPTGLRRITDARARRAARRRDRRRRDRRAGRPTRAARSRGAPAYTTPMPGGF